jgi:hypothetical protein
MQVSYLPSRQIVNVPAGPVLDATLPEHAADALPDIAQAAANTLANSMNLILSSSHLLAPLPRGSDEQLEAIATRPTSTRRERARG